MCETTLYKQQESRFEQSKSKLAFGHARISREFAAAAEMLLMADVCGRTRLTRTTTCCYIQVKPEAFADRRGEGVGWGGVP